VSSFSPHDVWNRRAEKGTSRGLCRTRRNVQPEATPHPSRLPPSPVVCQPTEGIVGGPLGGGAASGSSRSPERNEKAPKSENSGAGKQKPPIRHWHDVAQRTLSKGNGCLSSSTSPVKMQGFEREEEAGEVSVRRRLNVKL